MANRTDTDKPDSPGFDTDRMTQAGSGEIGEIVDSPTNRALMPEQPTPMQSLPTNASSAVPQHITIINQVQGGGGLSPALLAASGRLKDKSPILAAILSLAIVGVGQFYNNQIGKGLLMIILEIIIFISVAERAAADGGAALLWFAVAVWSVIDAYRVAKQKREIYTAALASMQSGQQTANAGS